MIYVTITTELFEVPDQTHKTLTIAHSLDINSSKHSSIPTVERTTFVSCTIKKSTSPNLKDVTSKTCKGWPNKDITTKYCRKKRDKTEE